MIAEVRLGNVRGFPLDATTGLHRFALKDLTLLCGTNSAGKSTVIKTMLLVKQIALQASLTGRVLFSGQYVDLGSYGTFVSKGKSKEGLRIGITIQDTMPGDLVAILRGGFARGAGEQSYYLDCDMEIGYRKYKPRAYSKFVPSAASEDAEGEDSLDPAEENAYIQKLAFGIRLEHEAVLSWTIDADQRESGEVFYRISLPKAFDRDELLSWEKYPAQKKFRKTNSSTFECVLRGLSAELMTTSSKDPAHAKRRQIGSPINIPIPFAIFRFQNALVKALRSIRYIAPLRAPAKRFYVASFDGGAIEDPTGEQVPFVIRDRAQQEVGYVGVLNEMRAENLRSALDYWIHYLRTGTAITTKNELIVSSRENFFVQLSIAAIDGSAAHAMSDSGFGYSQVLPIIAKTLLSKKGMLLVEQPELHLNPALQVRLAQFFAAMAKSGRRFVIETHSEHVVNMLRVLAAEDSSGALSRSIALYYLATSASGVRAADLSVLQDGTVPDWPLEFFGESITLSARLLRAQSRHLLSSEGRG